MLSRVRHLTYDKLAYWLDIHLSSLPIRAFVELCLFLYANRNGIYKLISLSVAAIDSSIIIVRHPPLTANQLILLYQFSLFQVIN